MKLIIGPANSGKTERIISRVVQAQAKAQGRVLLIVPSANAIEVLLKRLEAALDPQSPLSPKQSVVTFGQLYTSILDHAERKFYWPSAVERERLLRRVIVDLAEAGRLQYFAATADRPGLITAIASFIDELWRSGTDCAEFARVARDRKAKDRDISLIFEQCESRLASAGAVASEGAGLASLRALEKIYEARNAPSSTGFRASKAKLPFSFVAADGFDFYTTVQVRLLSLLSALGVETVAALTYEEGRPVHLWQQRTRARFEAASAKVEYCFTAPATVIESAAANLMRDADTPSSDYATTDRSSNNADDAVVKIISAPDRAMEARAVARELKRLVSEKQLSYDEAAIVCRSLTVYAHHLERVFREHLIPLTLDCQLALGENPLVIALLNLLRLASGAFPRRACIDSLRSPYFDFSCFGLDESAINDLDRASTAKKVTRDRQQWQDAIKAASEKPSRLLRDYAFDPGEESSLDDRRQRYESLIESLQQFFDAVTFEDEATPREHAERVKNLLSRLRVAERAKEGDTAARDAAALKQFCGLLDFIISDEDKLRPPLAAGESEIARAARWSTFYGELERAVATTSYERPPLESIAVLAQEAHNLRPCRFRVIFVMGLIEGEFPAKATETIPYSLIEREELRRAGLDFTETTNEPGADLTQFYKAMTRATDQLYLSYSRTDLAGGELLKSYLIDEVSAVSPAQKIRIAQTISIDEVLSHPGLASLEELAAATALEMRGRSEPGDTNFMTASRDAREAFSLLTARLPAWPATVRGAIVERRRLAGKERGPFDGVVRDRALLERLKKLLGPNHLWSATQINDYGVCPFLFFARDVLKLAPVVEPVEGFLADRLGTAYHEILERIYRALQAEAIALTPQTAEKAESIAEQASEDVLQGLLDRGEVRKGALWEFEKNEIKQRVAQLIRQEAEWNAEACQTPVALECRFGSDEAPPLEIECEGGEIKLRGTIDRIDERDDGLVVIDYKTGRAPIKHSAALDGSNLQLPIYMMAAQSAIKKDKKISSAYYLHILSRKKGSELPRPNDEKLSVAAMIEHAKDRIREHVTRARGGAFPAQPNNGKCPKFCAYDAMCRIKSLRSQAVADEQD